MDFQKYNIKEKEQKEKREKKKKATRIIEKLQPHHIKTIYGVCLKKIRVFFLKSNSRL